MAILTKEQILAANDRQVEEVAVPEWGGSVLVAVMGGSEFDAFEDALVEREHGKREYRALLASLTIVDDSMQLVFSRDEVEKLATKSQLALNRVAKVAARLNGIGAQHEEDAVKN